METGLKLLMRDGPVRVQFTPDLNTEQYAELMEIVTRLSTPATSDDLRGELESAATRWGVSVAVKKVEKLRPP